MLQQHVQFNKRKLDYQDLFKAYEWNIHNKLSRSIKMKRQIFENM